MEKEVKTTIGRIWFESVIDEAMQFAKERERKMDALALDLGSA